MTQQRQFRVSASYVRGTVQREAVVEAEKPQEAAVTAIWHGLLPMRFDRGPGGPQPIYCNPNHSWPEITEVAADGDTATVAFSWGIQDSPTHLMVKVVPAAEA
ncbi:MAG: hypothetical protein M1401_18260 [Chloroflexi bacterium]|nr:hypothetical protein [Chloroflexota bacterium]